MLAGRCAWPAVGEGMPPSSFRDYIEEVRAAADIADVIGDSVHLRRAGRRLVGLCPFHQEKAPSFQVDPDRGVFHCFGCRAGGSVFDFLMHLHGLEFGEAVTLLGDRLGIPRPRERAAGDKGVEGRRRRMLQALEEAQRLFRESLEGHGGQAAREYLESRGFTDELRGSFDLGFAPPGWDFLLTRLSARGFDVDLLIAAGLVARSDDGRRVYDRFRNRVTFPIRDSAGRIVSFGGRALDDNPAKYLNGPETEVFDKRRTLFRLFETSRQVRDAEQAIIVEGYFDALSLAAVGTGGVVAVCGTALSPDHARLLRRWCRRVVLFLDGDRAGREAARRSLGVLLREGLGVRVASAGEGVDPDDLARSRGSEGVAGALDEALEFPDFLAREASWLYDLSSVDGRVAACQWALEHLVLLPSALARAETADRVADALGIRDELMRSELTRAAKAQRRRLSRQAVGEAGSPNAPEPAFAPAEACLVRYVAASVTGEGARSPEAERALDLVPFETLTSSARAVLTACRGRLRDGAPVSLDRLCEELSTADRNSLLSLALGAEGVPSDTEVQSAVAALRVGLLHEQLKQIQGRIAEAKDPTEQDRLLRDKLCLAREIQALEAGSPPGSIQVPTGGD